MKFVLRGFLQICLLVLIVGATNARAAELSEFYRGVRAMGMGNAFTALAADADAVFYNPAGLSLNRAVSFHLFNPKIDASRDDVESVASIKETASGFDAGALSKFFGKNLYASATAYPSIQVPGFAIGYYYGANFHVVSRNQAMPRVEARYYTDKGVVSGLSREFRGISRRHFFRVGTTVKWLQRQGFDTVIPFHRLVNVDKDYFKSLIVGPEYGWGIDLGVQYEMPLTKNTDLILASAWHDIGDTNFGDNRGSGRPPKIRNNLTAGGAFIYRIGRLLGRQADFKIAAEARHLVEEDIDPRLQSHLGAELNIAGLGFQAGVNQSSLTGGVSLDMGFLKVAAVTYGVDNQAYAMMDRERRYMLQIDIGLDIGGKVFKTNRDENRRKYPRQY